MLEYRIIQSKANFCSEQALKLQNHISLHHLLKLIKYYLILYPYVRLSYDEHKLILK